MSSGVASKWRHRDPSLWTRRAADRWCMVVRRRDGSFAGAVVWWAWLYWIEYLRDGVRDRAIVEYPTVITGTSLASVMSNVDRAAVAASFAVADMRSKLAKARDDIARIRVAVEPLAIRLRGKPGDVAQIPVDSREVFAMRNVLAEVAAVVIPPPRPDGAIVAPSDAELVALMKLRGSGSRNQPLTDFGAPIGLSWRGLGIDESAAQAAWDRFHASEATP